MPLGAAAGAGAALGSLPDVPTLLASVRDGGLWFGVALGFGEFVTLARGTAFSARAARAGIYALRAAHATLTALWWGPWLFSATDTIYYFVIP